MRVVKLVLALGRPKKRRIGLLLALPPYKHVARVAQVQNAHLRVLFVEHAQYESASASRFGLPYTAYKQLPEVHLKPPLLSNPILVAVQDSTTELSSVYARVHAFVVPTSDSVSHCDKFIRADPSIFTSSVALLVVGYVCKARVEPVVLSALGFHGATANSALILQQEVSSANKCGQRRSLAELHFCLQIPNQLL